MYASCATWLYCSSLQSERGGKPKVESLDERDISPSHKFYNSLPDVDVEKDEQEVGLLYSIVSQSFPAIQL
jgi:hypothetical protein